MSLREKSASLPGARAPDSNSLQPCHSGGHAPSQSDGKRSPLPTRAASAPPIFPPPPPPPTYISTMWDSKPKINPVATGRDLRDNIVHEKSVPGEVIGKREAGTDDDKSPSLPSSALAAAREVAAAEKPWESESDGQATWSRHSSSSDSSRGFNTAILFPEDRLTRSPSPIAMSSCHRASASSVDGVGSLVQPQQYGMRPHSYPLATRFENSIPHAEQQQPMYSHPYPQRAYFDLAPSDSQYSTSLSDLSEMGLARSLSPDALGLFDARSRVSPPSHTKSCPVLPSQPESDRASSSTLERHSLSAPYDRRSASAPFACHSPSAPFDHHSPSAPFDHHSPPAPFDRHSPLASFDRYARGGAITPPMKLSPPNSELGLGIGLSLDEQLELEMELPPMTVEEAGVDFAVFGVAPGAFAGPGYSTELHLERIHDRWERYILELMVDLLLQDGAVSVGRMGSLLHGVTNERELSKMFRARYGGLKKFVLRFASIVMLIDDHPFNPTMILREWTIIDQVLPGHVIASLRRIKMHTDVSPRSSRFARLNRGHSAPYRHGHMTHLGSGSYMHGRSQRYTPSPPSFRKYSTWDGVVHAPTFTATDDVYARARRDGVKLFEEDFRERYAVGAKQTRNYTVESAASPPWSNSNGSSFEGVKRIELSDAPWSNGSSFEGGSHTESTTPLWSTNNGFEGVTCTDSASPPWGNSGGFEGVAHSEAADLPPIARLSRRCDSAPPRLEGVDAAREYREWNADGQSHRYIPKVALSGVNRENVSPQSQSLGYGYGGARAFAEPRLFQEPSFLKPLAPPSAANGSGESSSGQSKTTCGGAARAGAPRGQFTRCLSAPPNM